MQHLSKVELLALLREAKASRERDWLMILVGFWHGLRASEVTGFKRDAVRDGHLVIQRLKGTPAVIYSSCSLGTFVQAYAHGRYSTA